MISKNEEPKVLGEDKSATSSPVATGWEGMNTVAEAIMQIRSGEKLPEVSAGSMESPEHDGNEGYIDKYGNAVLGKDIRE